MWLDIWFFYLPIEKHLHGYKKERRKKMSLYKKMADKKVSAYYVRDIDQFKYGAQDNANAFFVSTSASEQVYTLACSSEEVGIDIEIHKREANFEANVKWLLPNHKNENSRQAWMRAWCRLEAYIKLYKFSINELMKFSKEKISEYYKKTELTTYIASKDFICAILGKSSLYPTSIYSIRLA